MGTITSSTGVRIGTDFGRAPDRVAEEAQKLVDKLGDFASQLDISYDDGEERIMIRMPGNLKREAEVRLEQAGVEKKNTGIRDLHYFNGVEVGISPYGGVSFG